MTYHYLLPTSELLDAIRVPRKLVASDRWMRIAIWIAAAGLFYFLMCVGLRYLNWVEHGILTLTAVSYLMISIVAVFAVLLLEAPKLTQLLKNPAKEMAVQIDSEADVELQFMKEVGQIPASVLLARHQYLDAQLAIREKWLDVVRLMAIIVPVVILLAFRLDEKTNISSWVELGMYASLAGLAAGAISVRAGITELQRLSFVLKKIGERRQADQLRRRQRRRR